MSVLRDFSYKVDTILLNKLKFHKILIILDENLMNFRGYKSTASHYTLSGPCRAQLHAAACRKGIMRGSKITVQPVLIYYLSVYPFWHILRQSASYARRQMRKFKFLQQLKISSFNSERCKGINFLTTSESSLLSHLGTFVLAAVISFSACPVETAQLRASSELFAEVLEPRQSCE